MKKKLFSLLTALVLCLLCAVPAFAEMPLVTEFCIRLWARAWQVSASSSYLSAI